MCARFMPKKKDLVVAAAGNSARALPGVCSRFNAFGCSNTGDNLDALW